MKYIVTLVFAVSLLTAKVDKTSAQQLKRSETESLNPKKIKQVIDSLSKAMMNYYVYPEKAIKIRDHLNSSYKKGLYNKITSPEELSRKLVSDISEVVVDRHIGLRFAPDAGSGVPPSQSNAERQADSLRDVKVMQQGNFNFTELKILPGNIGYLKFNAFAHDIEAAKPTIAAALTFLSHTSAIIIDMRHNGGGNVDMVSQLESYFFKQKTHMNNLVDRTSKDTMIFYADPAKTGGLMLNMPLYLLNSKRTFSGAEDFSYGMQGAGRAVLVGDTTGGGAHPVRPFPIGNGFTAFIPFARSLSPYTHTDWEGTGVYPDIAVPATDALEKALQVIYTRQLAATTDEHEQKAIKWQLDKLHARYHKPTVDVKLLAQYAGSYNDGSIKLFIKDSALFCLGKARNNYVSELSPISNDVFTWWDDTDFEIEFIKDESGHYTAFKILGPDGELGKILKDK
jgi:hypothetical protein